MNLNDLAREIHATSKEKGFWDVQNSCNHPEEHTCGVGICAFPGRSPFEVLMLIASESFEAADEIRDGRPVDEYRYRAEFSGAYPFPYEYAQNGDHYTVQSPSGTVQVLSEEQFRYLLQIHNVPVKPMGIPSELADVIIRTLDACAAWGIDIERALAEKIKYNKTRPHKHGRAK